MAKAEPTSTRTPTNRGHRSPGRPEIARRKDITEVRDFQWTSTIRYSYCGEFGHNMKSHKGEPGSLVNRTEKKRRNKKKKGPVGRPPKEGSCKATKKHKLSQAPQADGT